MTNREHFIATLQACYFGDRNAFEEIIRMYDEKENIIKEVREEMENAKHISINDSKAIIKHEKRILEILNKEVNND